MKDKAPKEFLELSDDDTWIDCILLWWRNNTSKKSIIHLFKMRSRIHSR